VTVSCAWTADRGYEVSFDDTAEALRFVMEWRFGYAGANRYDFQTLKRWGFPRPDSAPDNMDLDDAIERGLQRLLAPKAVQ
jgi:hypothetical protein